MPYLGAHMSIAGGLHLAFDRISRAGGDAMQIFVRNQRQWTAPPMTDSDAALFRRRWEESGRIPVAAHSSYLVNLADSDPEKTRRSIDAFADELGRVAALGIPLFVTHPGHHLGQGVEAGLRNYVQNLDRAISLAGTGTRGAAVSGVTVLIETTAGQGSGLGSTFEEIAVILDSSRYGAQLGVCFDTCHSFAAGYDFRTLQAYRETFSRFDALIGLARLKLFHLNDSKRALGSKVDRHEHIGKGEIGLDGFRLLLNDPRFADHPMILETPKEKDMAEDRNNLAVLRSLFG